MMIDIPGDLSEKISSVLTEGLSSLLYSVTNQAKSYMVTIILNGIMQELKTEISD